jgi:hypothetical protein
MRPSKMTNQIGSYYAERLEAAELYQKTNNYTNGLLSQI